MISSNIHNLCCVTETMQKQQPIMSIYYDYLDSFLTGFRSIRTYTMQLDYDEKPLMSIIISLNVFMKSNDAHK